MNLYKKALFISAAVFFAAGIFWGFQKGPLFQTESSKKSLRMLCKEEWIPQTALDQIEKELNVSIVREDFENWSKYLSLLANSQGEYDLICAHSFLAKDLSETQWLDNFNYMKLEGLKRVAPEFRGLPFDEQQTHFVPLGWSLNGYAFKKDSKLPHSWKNLWPGHGKQLSMNHPSLEMYVRMKDEDLEIDPQKQGRYNRDPKSDVEKFISRLGSIHHPGKKLTEEELKSREVFQVSNSQIADSELLKKNFNFEALEDGSNIWFLLIGVGSKSSQKEQARQVINHFLLPEISDTLHVKSGFAHVLSYFNDRPHVPVELKATYIRQFPLRHLKFPDLSLEGLPQWESYVDTALQESGLRTKD
ncbi:MAG: hypothetical protein CL676_11755 [Bdellovibrionaceae bacterium]|nr:hypothetical protein [Pseudobdellovibrionaceae bacterium]|tara:strand:+ start:332 stop:1411 length:1080 start_codon:yes stop_codon:yes gene_type:complete